MKEMQGWRIFFLIFLLVSPSSTHHPPENRNLIQEEERTGKYSIQPIAKAKSMLNSENVRDGIPDILANAGGIVSLAKIDYSGPPGQVFKAIGDSVIPIITVGLAVIPGGALISGVVSGLWGLISPFFGGSSKSPMEIMIDEIKDELLNLRNQIKELAKKIPEQMRKETDAKLTSLIHRAITGEIKRNEYICDKYAMVSQDFSEAIGHNQTVKESLRMEMISYINDCDNFLKDTAEAFVYPEYANVLWIPSVVTTLVRVAFLAEVTNYGQALELDEKLIIKFWMELKKDIKRHFKFFDAGVKKRVESFVEWKQEYAERMTYTDAEYEACHMQAELLYLDRQMYPYGVPDFFNRVNENTELNIADFNVTGQDEPRHISVYYNGLFKNDLIKPSIVLNCMGGPERIVKISTFQMSFPVTYVPNKTYEIRIIYFTKEVGYGRDSERKHQKVVEFNFKKVTRSTVTEEGSNTLKILVKGSEPNISSINRLEIKTAFQFLQCNKSFPAKGLFKHCRAHFVGYSGTYVVEHVATLNVDAGDEVNGKIVVENPEADGRKKLDMFIFGVEIVVLPNRK